MSKKIFMSIREQSVMDAIISHQIDLMRFDAHLRNRVLFLLDSMGGDLEAKIDASGLTDFQRARFNALLADTSKVIDSYYSTISREADYGLQAVIKMQSSPVVFASVLDAALPTEGTIKQMMSDTMIQGAPSADWWARQGADMKWRFTNEVRDGLMNGDTRSAIASRVRDELDVSKNNAEALVRTSVAEVAGAARLDTYRANDDIVTGLRQLSTLDGRTTDICIAYADGEWSLDGDPINGTTLDFNGGPPRHWNCRSVLVPILDTTDALGFDISGGSSRAAEGGPVAADTSFDEWLSKRTPAQQDEQLGPGRAQMYRDGTITLPQLLNQRGNPLTLQQLEAKVARGKK